MKIVLQFVEYKIAGRLFSIRLSGLEKIIIQAMLELFRTANLNEYAGLRPNEMP